MYILISIMIYSLCPYDYGLRVIHIMSRVRGGPSSASGRSEAHHKSEWALTFDVRCHVSGE